MKKARCFIFTLFTFVIFGFIPNSFAQDSRPIVRLIYFLPSDRQPQPDIDSQIDTLIKDVQRVYADEMERHGFGRKTFQFEADENGKAVVHHISLKFEEMYYQEDWGKVWDELPKEFDRSENFYVGYIEADAGGLCGFADAHGSMGGSATMFASGPCALGIWATTHEFGHFFGLAHDFRNDLYHMSYGEDGKKNQFSQCAAEWLDGHPAFNRSQPAFDEPTTIRMLAPSLAAPPNTIRLRFEVTDPNGLHQAQLQADATDEDPARTPKLIACKSLSGASRTVEFVTSLLTEKNKFVFLAVMDAHGNFRQRRFSIDVSVLRQPPKVVSISDANLAAVIRENLSLAPSETITTHAISVLAELDASGREITDLTGIEHAQNLRWLDLWGNQISDVSSLVGLKQLSALSLGWNQISDISALSDLKQLYFLVLDGNQIEDVSSLVGLKQLSALYLSRNQISDISALSDLRALSILYLGWNQISDISALSDLRALSSLHLEKNRIKMVSSIAKLVNLRHLNLANNLIVDPSPLAGLINLENLYLHNNLISDISSLDGLFQNIHITWYNNPGFPSGGPKIEGPWLWVIVPTGGTGGSSAAASGIDFLAAISGGTVTETQIATEGAKEGDPVADKVWTMGEIASTDRNNINTMVNATGLGVGNIDYHVAYGLVSLYSSDKQDTTMYVGSDDAVKVWLNGALIHNNPVDRGADDYQDVFPVTLRRGANILLVAVYNGTVNWSGFFGFAPGTEYTVLLPGADITALLQPVEDVNGDGTVNIQDLVLVAANLGETGENAADVNGDSVVNIQDLVLVAAALGTSATAPPLLHPDTLEVLTSTDVRRWLTQANQLNLTDATSRRGILFLAQLLAALTPKETALLANYPNPFNPETWIPYQLAKDAEVSLTIYAVDGQVVRQLALGHQPAGRYQSRSRAVYWDGKNAVGERVASGVYFYTLTAGDFSATRKMLILK